MPSKQLVNMHRPLGFVGDAENVHQCTAEAVQNVWYLINRTIARYNWTSCYETMVSPDNKTQSIL